MEDEKDKENYTVQPTMCSHNTEPLILTGLILLGIIMLPVVYVTFKSYAQVERVQKQDIKIFDTLHVELKQSKYKSNRTYFDGMVSVLMILEEHGFFGKVYSSLYRITCLEGNSLTFGKGVRMSSYFLRPPNN